MCSHAVIPCVSSFYPTLKFFANGYPTDYDGPHSTQALITHVRRLTAPAIEVYTSESRFRDFLSSRGSDLPIFVGFGLEASSLEKLAHKYRNKGWFAVLREYSENAHEDFRFDERHAVVVLHGDDEVQDVYYGPFDGTHKTLILGFRHDEHYCSRSFLSSEPN